MKMRTIRLTSHELTDVLQGKGTLIPNLSDDIELLDVKFDLLNNEVTIIVRSENFEDIPETYPIPEIGESPTGGRKTIMISKTATQPVSISKEDQQRRVQQQSNQYAAKMGEEFTPEQRRLLSFSVSGDSIIVKPIQFLKAEWDDINETVKA